jgi:hypothetical protein
MSDVLMQDLPTVSDGSGYIIRQEDLDFLGIERDALFAWHAHEVPLGVNKSQFIAFRQTLYAAMRSQGIVDADVRIQGSSAQFFSSPLKPFPQGQSALADIYITEFGRVWSRDVGEAILEIFSRQWPHQKPGRRPFDALYKLGLSPEPSDIDVQISSAGAFALMRAYLNERGIDPTRITIKNNKYSFMRKELSETVFLDLRAWAEKWTADLQRDVNIAIFDLGGPQQSEDIFSSHYQDSDWVMEAVE